MYTTQEEDSKVSTHLEERTQDSEEQEEEEEEECRTSESRN